MLRGKALGIAAVCVVVAAVVVLRANSRPPEPPPPAPVLPGVAERVVAVGQWHTQPSIPDPSTMDTPALDERGCVVVSAEPHCPEPGWQFSLPTNESDGVQWRATKVGEPCARWFRLPPGGPVSPVEAGPDACRAAILLHAGEWELTADFPPYEVGAAHPGPFAGRRGDDRIVLDNAVLDVERCGEHVYWLSRPTGSPPRGGLARWTPGSGRVEVLDLPDAGAFAGQRCVHGILNVVTEDGAPRLWYLGAP